MQKGFVRNKKGGLVYYTIPSFENYGVKHIFTTRLGGSSKKPFESMNLSLRRYNDKREIYDNFHIVCDNCGFKYEDLVLSDQVHGDRIAEVGVNDKGKGLYKKSDIKDADCLATDTVGVPLVTFYADCVPLFFYDSVKKAIALAHSGWRGTSLEIGRKTVEFMAAKYGSKPADIISAIGPSIGPCCYEVEYDVAKYFLNYDKALYNKAGGKYMLDLQRVNAEILRNAGISDEHITVSGICTSCSDEFYSYRRDKGVTGSMAAFMSL